MKKLKIFISSVQKEFKAERLALRDFITADPLCRRYFEVFLFEDMPVHDRNPDAVYTEEVKNSDMYVCLLGNEYGAEDDKGLSPTEREFHVATKNAKTRLLFIKDGPDALRHPKMAKLIRKAGGQLIRRRFSSIPELTTQLYAGLVQYLEDNGILQTVPFDAAACRGASLEDIDEKAVQWFLETARAERKFALDKNTSAEKLFAHLDLFNDGKLAHAALLLFGKKPQKFRSLISAEVKCLHFHGTEVCKPIPSYQIYKGILFEQVDQAVDFVLSKLDRSVAPGKTGAASEVAYEIPKPVIREAVVNAVAHRDYTSNAAVQVMLFADRFEVWNPGALPVGMTPETLRVPHSSVPHNPLISEPLFLAHYIERAGTGTMDMIALCKKSGLPEPDFEQRDGQFVITIWRNWLTYEVMIGMELNDRQRKALVYVKENRRIANLEYQRVTGCIKKTASRDLDELVRKGVFAKFGSTGRGTFYGLVNKGDIKGTKETFRGTYGKGDIKGTKPPQRRQREAGEDT